MSVIEKLQILASKDGVCGGIQYIATNCNKLYYRCQDAQGTKVIDEDWDNLLILDGCRYDAFKDINSLDGCLERRESLGSTSGEFLRRNFRNEECHDIVYVSANPFVPELPSGTFHDVINLLSTNWNEKLGTVPPDAVINKAIDAREKYPDKRLIIHFMQPHYPFIGDFGRQFDTSELLQSQGSTTSDYPIWVQLQFGLTEASIDDVWQAYRENLRLVMEKVSDLLPNLVGRSIVTADHGNLIGDRIHPIPVKGYGHTDHLHVPELVDVPWLIIEDEDRPKIEPEPPVDKGSMDDDTLEERLEALGYA